MTSVARLRGRRAARQGAWIPLAVLPFAAAAARTGVPATGTDRGEAIYRRALDSAGRPLRAVVSRDVRMAGPAAACTACHSRSGFGSFEGTTAAPPVIGRVLFAPRAGGAASRPAYDVAGLGRALRDGIDPAGRTLSPLMPRYDLADAEVEQLARYLSELSATLSPGVDATTLHLATVVTPDSDPQVRKDTLEVLHAFVRGKNARTRGEGRPGKRDSGFREWRLAVWALKDPEQDWPAQLERLYRAQPVFALVGGAGGTRWEPVHDFCERHGIPSILPNLDVLPEKAGQGFYNLYFSPGLAVEAAAVASAVASRPGARTVQVLDEAVAAVESAARDLRSALAARGVSPAVDVQLGSPASLAPALEGASDVVLWLRGEALARALRQLSGSRSEATLYLSATLLGEETPVLPAGWAARTVVARPYALPPEVERRFRRTSAWLRGQGIAAGDARTQDQTLSACSVLAESLVHAGVELVRDYVVERIDHGGGMQQLSSYYRSLAFGPSQRILSRGCYLVSAESGAAAPAWVIP